MTWPLVEDGLRLPVHRTVIAGLGGVGWLGWRWTRHGALAGEIQCRVILDAPRAGRLELSYRCDGRPFAQAFALEAEPCRFGGLRWFAICPRRRRRVSKLYCIGGAGFHSRHAYGRLAYAAQRTAQGWSRALHRRDRILFAKLKADDPDDAPKPKWMRWRTYDRLVAQLEAAEAECDRQLAGLIARLG